MVILPIAVDAHLSTSSKPMLYPTLPLEALEDTCTAEDPVFGRCQMWPTTHTYHRVRWDGYEASWKA